jgi:hypothetical protein
MTRRVKSKSLSEVRDGLLKILICPSCSKRAEMVLARFLRDVE